MAREAIIERLAKLDTCAVSDALDSLGLKGATWGVRPQWQCPRIVGRAVTMKIKPAGLQQPTQHLGTAPIEAAKAWRHHRHRQRRQTGVFLLGRLVGAFSQIKRIERCGDRRRFARYRRGARSRISRLCARRGADDGARAGHAGVLQPGNSIRRRAMPSRRPGHRRRQRRGDHRQEKKKQEVVAAAEAI